MRSLTSKKLDYAKQALVRQQAKGKPLNDAQMQKMLERAWKAGYSSAVKDNERMFKI